jgi:hypothetical protein
MGSKSKKLAIETLKAWLEDIKRGKGRPKPQKDYKENIRK